MNISISAETLFHVGSFPVTNSLMATWLTVILLAGIALLLKRRVATVPGRGQAAAEMVLEGTLGIMDSITDDRKQTRRYLPLVACRNDVAKIHPNPVLLQFRFCELKIAGHAGGWIVGSEDEPDGFQQERRLVRVSQL